MKNIDTYIFEGLIGSRTRDIKPVEEVLRDVFNKLNGPSAKETTGELYDMTDILPGVKKYISGGIMRNSYIQKNDPIIISFKMRRQLVNNIYISRPKENVCIYINFYFYGKSVHRLSSFQSAAPFVYIYTNNLASMFRLSDSFDSWIIDKDTPSRSIFEEVVENLGK